MIGHRCQIQPSRSWETTLNTMQTLSGEKTKKKLVLLGWQFSIYSIWTERNHRLHHQNYPSADSILLLISHRFGDSKPKNQLQRFQSETSLWVSSLFGLYKPMWTPLNIVRFGPSDQTCTDLFFGSFPKHLVLIGVGCDLHIRKSQHPSISTKLRSSLLD